MEDAALAADGPATGPQDAVRRAQAGDPRAFDALYEGHVGRVYALCLRMCADTCRAEELTQDVFVRAWRAIGSFRGESAFGSWLHRVAVNVVLDDARRRKRRPTRRLDDVPDAALPTPSATDPTARVELERALASLPERARMALVLHAVEGYRYEEVAQLMGVALGTVKSHIHTARALLIERLERT